jgi:hypothetical protein
MKTLPVDTKGMLDCNIKECERSVANGLQSQV